MILYNVTINIDVDKEEEFIDWMKHVHMPKVMETGMFFDCKFFRLIQENTGEGVNYSAQYFTETFEKLQLYQEQFADVLRSDIKEKFGNHYVSFRSVLESVD
ncbi:DUF4286 family protein [Negadavirga shengliensis]|uniref:DUF4286 family protein n=1 Tax=Negadavirga shengliensis TaxID=1389218 RepID=A0ABV9SVX9_9BACT